MPSPPVTFLIWIPDLVRNDRIRRASVLGLERHRALFWHRFYLLPDFFQSLRCPHVTPPTMVMFAAHLAGIGGTP